MEIYIRGLASGYEPEHVARLFFQPALLAKRWPARGADAVAVLRGKKRFVCGVRMNGLCAVRTAPLAQDTPPEQAEYEICRLLFLLLCEATGRYIDVSVLDQVVKRGERKEDFGFLQKTSGVRRNIVKGKTLTDQALDLLYAEQNLRSGG